MGPIQGSWEPSLFWYLTKFNQSLQGTFVRDASTEIFFASTSEHLQRPFVFDIFFRILHSGFNKAEERRIYFLLIRNNEVISC